MLRRYFHIRTSASRRSALSSHYVGVRANEFSWSHKKRVARLPYLPRKPTSSCNPGCVRWGGDNDMVTQGQRPRECGLGELPDRPSPRSGAGNLCASQDGSAHSNGALFHPGALAGASDRRPTSRVWSFDASRFAQLYQRHRAWKA